MQSLVSSVSSETDSCVAKVTLFLEPERETTALDHLIVTVFRSTMHPPHVTNNASTG